MCLHHGIRLLDSQASLARQSWRSFVPTHPTALAVHLRNIVLQRTNRGIWNLAVEVLPERVVLRGETTTFYSKQLAQESIRKMLPTVMVQNAIEVAA
jgi:hypothetical protein